jgi:chemotaxis protein CheX
MPIDPDLLVRCVTVATTEVFSMMLDMEVSFAELSDESETSDSGLISLVGITGAWGGSGVFCCSPSLASMICSRMLGTVHDAEKPTIDEEVLDVVAEVTNMIVGNIKNGLEEVTGPLAISVPTVIHGRNFQFRNALGLRGASLAFTAEEERFEIRIALAPVSPHTVSHPRTPVLNLSHV